MKQKIKFFLSSQNPLLVRSLLYLLHHRRVFRFWNPQTFTEKLNWRILHDRRPELQWMGDKVKMKIQASQFDSSVLIPQTLWSGQDLSELLNLDLEGNWILKPIGSSGFTYFGSGVITQDILDEILIEMPSSHIKFQASFYQEWIYEHADDGYLLEERIGDGEIDDYKFFVFNGEVALSQLDEGRFSSHHRTFFDRDGGRMNLQVKYPTNQERDLPAQYSLMVKAAEVLSDGLDFVRIDLYLIGQSIYFGEYSPYPGSGLESYNPRTWDYRLGRLWQLPVL